MGFNVSIYPVRIDNSMTSSLLARVRELYELKKSPTGSEGCKNCVLLDELIGVVM